jgi:hypothetical protein
MVDPNNANGDSWANSYSGCCKQPMGLCNAPDPSNNGVNLDPAKAMCSALGYSTGIIVRWVNSNTCPEVHAVTADGKKWSSDFTNAAGYGAEYKCIGFK